MVYFFHETPFSYDLLKQFVLPEYLHNTARSNHRRYAELV